MAKRFTDTELWKKEWFQELSLVNKLLLRYIFDNCDCAGIWDANFRMASFIIGENVSVENLKQINSAKLQFEFIDDRHVFALGFIEFQYGTLSETCKPHLKVIELLKKYNLYENFCNFSKGTLRVSEGLAKGIVTLEEKEKEKEEEKDKDKEEEKENFSKNEEIVQIAKKITPDAKEVCDFFADYKRSKNERFRPAFKDKKAVAELLTLEGGYDPEYWNTVFLKAKQGWHFVKNGETIKSKCKLSRILAEHSEIYADEANLKPLSSVDKMKLPAKSMSELTNAKQLEYEKKQKSDFEKVNDLHSAFLFLIDYYDQSLLFEEQSKYVQEIMEKYNIFYSTEIAEYYHKNVKNNNQTK